MDQGPAGLIPSIQQISNAGAPPPQPLAQPGAPGPAPYHGEDAWLADYQKEHGAEIAERSQKRQIEEARVAALRQEHGAAETFGTKIVQGALDALLAPGALAGAAAETVGEAWQSSALKDFGRGLGEAASGTSAMQAAGGLARAAFEDNALAGAGEADDIKRKLREQEEARPLLSTLSRMAGMSAAAVLGGVAASGESGLGAIIAANTAEGAAGGAQAAYEHSAPLRDVLTSAAVGGVLGGAIAGVGEAVQAGLRRTPDLAKVFGEKVQEFADSRALKAVIDRDPKAWKTFLKGGEERVQRVAERIRATDILGKGDEGMLEGLNKAAGEAGDNLAAIAQHLDDSKIVPSVESLTERLDAQVAKLRSSGSGTEQAIADSLEREVAPFKSKLAVKGIDNLGNETTVGYRNPTFTELREFKQGLGRAKAAQFTSNNPAAQATSEMYGSIAETLNEAAGNAGPTMQRAWKQSNEAATDFITLRDALENQIARKAKNRYISASDYGTSVAAGLATLMHTANPIAAGVAAVGSAIGHKMIREGGSSIISSLANRFARTSRHVSLAAAGGPEMQEVLQSIARTKAFMAETAERAGANPTLRKGAEDAARQVAAEQLAKKAGPFNPAAWAEKPLNPLQKVLYRTQVLDAASGDIAKTAEHLASLHPEIPAELDLRRLGKLTKDADGPAAIGSAQQLAQESAAAAPLTPTGDAGGVVLRKLGLALDRTDTAEAIAKTHEAANWFREAQASAPDEMSQVFAARTEAALRAELGQPHWGQAGEEYAKMTAAPHAALTEAADPMKVREVLKAGEGLTNTARAAMDQIADAHASLAKLTGARAAAPELGKQLKAAEKLFQAAEEALTLDGAPMARLFDVANATGVYGGSEARLEKIHEGTLADHVESGLDKIAPLLSGEKRQAGETAVTEVASREQYDQRMKTLTRTTAQPDATASHPMYAGIAPQVGTTLQQLLQDMPKPSQSVHGKVFETLSRDDLRLANAMWEATTEPLSVFSDLADGTLDPDKAAYAWKQYPGLQKAAQAGVVDVLMGLPDEKRGEVPESVLTQLDSALGFGGGLQDANMPDFAQRMSALYQPPPAPPKPGGQLDMPGAEPSFTDRLAGTAQ